MARIWGLRPVNHESMSAYRASLKSACTRARGGVKRGAPARGRRAARSHGSEIRRASFCTRDRQSPRRGREVPRRRSASCAAARRGRGSPSNQVQAAPSRGGSLVVGLEPRKFPPKPRHANTSRRFPLEIHIGVLTHYTPCGLEPGSSGTHRINGCARFGIRKTLKFKAFVPRTHRNASNMPASPFLFKNSRARARHESRGARIGGGTAVAPCGARGGPGAAQARLPSHAVALHPPPVHPCVRPLREVPCRHGAERRRRASEAPGEHSPRHCRARMSGAGLPRRGADAGLPRRGADARSLCGGF